MKTLVCVFLVLFVLVKVMCCEGCWKQEREALVALNFSLEYDMTAIPTDCCKWEGVECNITTGRVIKLKPIFMQNLNYLDFLIFQDLRSLDLTSIQISNCTGPGYLYKFYILIHLIRFFQLLI